MAQLKVLMADDEPDVLSVMAKKIAREGYDVLTAADGQEAWEKIEQDSPDLILLDINMPVLSGFDVLKKVRENPSSSKWQPVIIISARRELESMEKSYSLEADHYITKPCQITDILKAIKLMAGLIHQHKSESENNQNEL